MKYYAVYTDLADALQPMHIRDKRKLSRIGKDLVEAGYLVSEAVKIRQAFTGYDDGEQTYTQHYFSADPQGAILFLKDHIRQISKVVVPEDALPMPDA